MPRAGCIQFLFDYILTVGLWGHLLSFKKWVLSENRNKVGFPRWLSGKDSTSQSEHAGSVGWIPGLGRTLGEGNGYPLQYSCLEDSMDQGAWQATVYGVTKSQI